MNDDSRSRHPSRLGPRTTDDDSPAEDDDLLYLVEKDNQKYRHKHLSLAQLYRKAKDRGLVQPHTQYR
jgi:hypothetical protein